MVRSDGTVGVSAKRCGCAQGPRFVPLKNVARWNLHGRTAQGLER